MSNGVFNFNFLGLLLSDILGGSQIYTRGPYPTLPGRPLAEKYFYPKRVLHHKKSENIADDYEMT